MGNNGNCDVCSGNQRNQMDMRRQKAMMYENRYAQNQMMPRMQNGCDAGANARVINNCDTCAGARINNGCDSCGNTRMKNTCDTCDTVRMMHQHDDCGNSQQDELRGMPLAMGYVPWQNFGCTYEPMEGLRAGTIFPELEKPFYGRRGMR